MKQEQNLTFTWHNLFEFSLILRGLNGIFEVLLGVAILFINKHQIERLTNVVLKRGEVPGQRHSHIVNIIINTLEHLSRQTKVIAGLYVLFHGVLNIFLAIGLYQDKIRSYIITIWFLCFFIVLQSYRLYLHFTWLLFAITVFDIIFVILTWHEYKYRIARRAARDAEQVDSNL